MGYYNNKTILVTGGAGSIGSELVKKLMACKPKSIRVMDINENALYALENSMRDQRARFLVGDIRDKNRLSIALEKVDIVFNAAALKHVPFCEYNPYEAIKTNVIGTQNLIEVCKEKCVKKMIMISTDKAVNPTGVMGATKMLAERITTLANRYIDEKETCYATVRFGNVLSTNGSVVPLFKQQIKEGVPVTITDEKMTRFTMSISAAVDLILKATVLARGGEIFILKMPSFYVGDLATAVIERYGTFGARKEIIGARPGEKVYEELLTEDEAKNTYENEEMFVILPDPPLHINQGNYLPTRFKKYQGGKISSDNVKKMSKEDIMGIV